MFVTEFCCNNNVILDIFCLIVDDAAPLEDMSDLLHQVEALREIRGQQPQPVNNNNSNANVRPPTNVIGAATLGAPTLNNASAKQNNVTREAQAQVSLVFKFFLF